MMKKQSQIEAAPKVAKDIGKWLRENVYLVREDDAGKFNRIMARQLVKGNKRGEEVFYIDVPKRPSDEWCDSTGIEIYGRLQAEASTLGGLQKYALYAYCSGDNENHVSRFVLRIQGADDEDDDDMLSEGPDKHGLTSQAMRHAEVYAKINTGAQMTLLNSYQSMVHRLSTMVEKLMDARINSIDVIEEMINKKHERDIQVLQAETKAKAVRDVAGKLGLFIPALANKIAGQNLFPVQANAVMLMTKGLITALAADEERLGQIMNLLKPEEQIAFMNVLEEVSRNVDDSGLPVDRAQSNGATATQEKE